MRLLCLHGFFPGLIGKNKLDWSLPLSLGGLSLVASACSMEVWVLTSPSPSPLKSLALVISLGGKESAYYAVPHLSFGGQRVGRLEARWRYFCLSWPAYDCPVSLLSFLKSEWPSWLLHLCFGISWDVLNKWKRDYFTIASGEYQERVQEEPYLITSGEYQERVQEEPYLIDSFSSNSPRESKPYETSILSSKPRTAGMSP